MPKLLQQTQVDHYATNGFTFGVPVLSREELAWYNSEIERFEGKLDSL